MDPLTWYQVSFRLNLSRASKRCVVPLGTEENRNGSQRPMGPPEMERNFHDLSFSAKDLRQPKRSKWVRLDEVDGGCNVSECRESTAVSRGEEIATS